MALAVLLLTVAWPALAQVFDLEKDRQPVVALDGRWRFHAGDDPHWADPNFDDSKWSLIDPAKSWEDQGYSGYRGYAWYRIQLTGASRNSELTLLVPWVFGSYTVYADGVAIGGVGDLNSDHRTTLYVAQNRLYRLKLPATPNGRVSVSIRVWFSPDWRFSALAPPGLSAPAPLVGEARAIAGYKSLQDKALVWSLSSTNYILVLKIIALLAGLTLVALRPTDREYLWFSGIQLFDLLHDLNDLWFFFHAIPLVTYLHLYEITNALDDVFLVLLVFRLVGSRRTRPFWLALGITIAEFPGEALFVRLGLVDRNFYYPATVCLAVILLFRLRASFRKGHRDVLLLSLYVSLGYVFPFLFWVLGQIDLFLKSSAIEHLLLVGNQFSEWPFPFGLGVVFVWLGELFLLGILVSRFDRARREEQRLGAELESARTVQSVLIPTEIPSVPGFALSAVYKPATQVGGDLFQILPTRSGGVLVVIGDVSGKGMPAAMTVSLLVGTLRTLAHYTQSPGEILLAMNQRMLARSSGGFTTCLALKIDADGSMTVANAGHIAPYLNGAELEIDNGLPLGLFAESTYQESTFNLQPDEQLTLMTDGVVEARSRTGELFGFERVTEIAMGTAERIARTAQEFGQEDDITVVTVTRCTEGPRLVQLPASTVSEEFA
jgi:hypothetical protein